MAKKKGKMIPKKKKAPRTKKVRKEPKDEMLDTDLDNLEDTIENPEDDE